MAESLVELKQRIYIAGPMRGKELHNFPAFDAAEERLAHAGWTPVSPARLNRAMGYEGGMAPDDPDDVKLLSLILQDLLVLVSVDAIFLLKGWEDSKGAKLEKAMAEFLGKDVYYEYPSDPPLTRVRTNSARNYP